MAARVPRVLNATIELGFVFAAGMLGYLKAPLWTAPALALGMIAYWAFNRRAGLGQLQAMGGVKLTGAVLVSLVLITAVLAGAYWIGGLASGRTI